MRTGRIILAPKWMPCHSQDVIFDPLFSLTMNRFMCYSSSANQEVQSNHYSSLLMTRYSSKLLKRQVEGTISYDVVFFS